MTKIKFGVLSICLATAAFAGQFTVAASPSQVECEAAGGTFSKERGQVVCVLEENVGKSENSQTVTDTTTGRGNIDNKQTKECDGPGNSGANSAHCP